MRKLQFILSALILILVGCAREDDIRPIDNLPMHHCIIGSDTVYLSDVIRFQRYEARYYFYVNDNLLVAVDAIEDSLGSTATLENIDGTNSCHVYYNGDSMLFNYIVTTRQIAGEYEIHVDGISVQDTSLKIQLSYRGSILDLNQKTGCGYLAKDFDTIAISQLRYRGTLVGGYYELIDAQNIDSYSLGRIRIIGNPHSGSYELANNGEIQVYYERGIPGTCPGVVSYPVTKGTLQFSNSTERYSIILHGETEHWKIALEYNGKCFDSTLVPLEW